MTEKVLLGKLLHSKADRDATHVAVIPVVAAEALAPGTWVGLENDGEASTDVEKKIGIVDPFLKTDVPIGAIFYLCLTPGSITGLRHHYSHPDLPSSGITKDALYLEAKVWMDDWSSDNGMSYEEAIEAGHGYLDHWNMVEDNFAGLVTPEEYWDNFQVLTGRLVPHDKRGSFFDCCV